MNELSKHVQALQWRHNEHHGVSNHQQWWPVDSPQEGPVTRKMFPLDDVIVAYKMTRNYELHEWLSWFLLNNFPQTAMESN